MEIEWIDLSDDSHNDAMAKQCYEEDGYIVLKVRDKYEIDLKRCSNHKELLHWVRHLLGKNWVTTDLIVYFIDLVHSTTGVNPWTGETDD